jgi:hypothetical protein
MRGDEEPVGSVLVDVYADGTLGMRWRGEPGDVLHVITGALQEWQRTLGGSWQLDLGTVDLAQEIASGALRPDDYPGLFVEDGAS